MSFARVVIDFQHVRFVRGNLQGVPVLSEVLELPCTTSVFFCLVPSYCLCVVDRQWLWEIFSGDLLDLSATQCSTDVLRAMVIYKEWSIECSCIASRPTFNSSFSCSVWMNEHNKARASLSIPHKSVSRCWVEMLRNRDTSTPTWRSWAQNVMANVVVATYMFANIWIARYNSISVAVMYEKCDQLLGLI